MSTWNLAIESPNIPYSFWSFNRHGQGRNTRNILDATLGVYQAHPLNFKSSDDALIIEGANNPSSKTIEWKINNKGRRKNVSASITSKYSKIVIEIDYANDKYSFELKNMKQNRKLHSISKTDLDLIIRNNFGMALIFDILTLICDYNNCIFDMNNGMEFLKYHDLKESKSESSNIINTIPAKRDSYVQLDMANELINGNYSHFIVECECNPQYFRHMGIAGIVSLHGGGTGWELRVSLPRHKKRKGAGMITRRHTFEWVFTTHWCEESSDKKHWMHNELSVEMHKTYEARDEWIYLKGEYDFVNGLQLFTVNEKTISRRIKGKPQVETRRGVEFGRGYGSKDRIYYGLIRNVKIDGWD